MNCFKEAEYVLYNYPKLRTALNNLKTRKSQLIHISAPSDKTSAGITPIGTNSVNVNNTYKDLTELAQTVANISITENKVNEIETLLNELSDEERTIIQLWYFQQMEKENILEHLNISSLDCLYKKRKMAVNDFAVLYFGAIALS